MEQSRPVKGCKYVKRCQSACSYYNKTLELVHLKSLFALVHGYVILLYLGPWVGECMAEEVAQFMVIGK